MVPVLLTSVDDFLDGFGHLPLEQGVEEFDQEDEAGAEHDEGPGQQHQPHGQVGQGCVGEEVLACPTARLGKGLGPARPRSQTYPHGPTCPPARHLPALPHITIPALLGHRYNPPAPPAPPRPRALCPSPAQAPHTHSHFCLVTLWRTSMPLVLQWPGDEQFGGAPSPTVAICREKLGYSSLHGVLSRPLPTTHPLWDCLVAPAGPSAPHLRGCRATPDADEAPVAQALVPCRDARDHRFVQLQEHTCWRGQLGAKGTHGLGTSSLAWGHHCQLGDTWIQPPSKGHQCRGHHHQPGAHTTA